MVTQTVWHCTEIPANFIRHSQIKIKFLPMFSASVVTFILFMLCFGFSPNPSLHLYFCPFHCCNFGVFHPCVWILYGCWSLPVRLPAMCSSLRYKNLFVLTNFPKADCWHERTVLDCLTVTKISFILSHCSLWCYFTLSVFKVCLGVLFDLLIIMHLGL